MWTPVIEYRWGGEVCKYDHGVYSSEKQGQIGDKVILLVDITNPEKVTDRRSIRMQKSVGLSFIFVTVVFALFDIFIAAPLLEML